MRAVDLLVRGEASSVIGIRNNAIIDMPIEEGLLVKKVFNKKLFDIAHAIST